MLKKRLFSILFACLFTIGEANANEANADKASADKEINYTIYLTRDVLDNQPTRQAATDFDCNDRIYLVVEALGLSEKQHQLLVRWENPLGEKQEQTNYSFEGFSYTRTWAWLQLSGPPGAIIGQMFDPSFGMEEFIGKWRAQVAIDKKKIDSLEFNVLC